MDFKIILDGKYILLNEKCYVYDLLDDKNKEVIAVKVDGVIRELSFIIDKPCEIKTLTLLNEDAMLIYRKSLCYLFAMAFKRIYPNLQLRFSYSISRSFYISIINESFTDKMIDLIKEEMFKIVKSDYKFNRFSLNNEQAKTIINKYQQDYKDKLNILKYRPEPTTHFYECGGFYDYFYERMVYSTGYLSHFNLIKKGNGVLLQYPRSEENGLIPDFVDNDVYFKALNDSDKWGEEMSASTVSDINEKFIDEKSTIDFINECEARHSRLLVELGNIIEENVNTTKLIAIAGPSSSGKTTFANRLRVELLSRGIHPIMISLDNYYLPRSMLPKDENGELDFESINALNIELFNSQMKDLINGKSVEIPIYHFGKKENSKSEPISLKSNKDIIIIEGIHALNDTLTKDIDRKQKYKIYISPQIQVNIDNENPLSLTDFRLLRRIIRDYKFRGTSVLETIKMWPSVRRGEFKWIYNSINDADYVFNSFSFYELSVYSTLVYEFINEIDRNDPNYKIVERLLRIIKFFKKINFKWIPCNSIIREFIGDSCFN